MESMSKVERFRWVMLIAALGTVVLASCASYAYFPRAPVSDAKVKPVLSRQCMDCHLTNNRPAREYSFTRDIQPILNRRCLNCHSCYDAPGQLNLSCAGGVDRGACKERVYDQSRLVKATHTRMHVDGNTVEDWRKRGFYPVTITTDEVGTIPRLRSSVMYQMITLARANPLPKNTQIRHLQKDSHDPAMAPRIDEYGTYADRFPNGGMPYLTSGLTDQEFISLASWLAQGAKTDQKPSLVTSSEKREIQKWEAFLNQESPRSQLISRYLYEHWFVAHLYFRELPAPAYFKLVRSRTAPGTPIDPIVTALPNQLPNATRVYYRFKKLHGLMKRKTHLPYALDDRRMKRLKALFYETDWKLSKLPGFSSEESVRPFVVYADIPARSRYLFMLDNADFFIRCFIRGPVCRGQAALNAIHDQTYLMFQDPDSDPSITDPDYLSSINGTIVLPGNVQRLLGYPVTYTMVKRHRKRYLAVRRKYLDAQDKKGPALTDIWRGNGPESSPMLTVYRHFDTGSVTRGFIPPTPKTAWVIDYPTFERIYYLLVVNYDVYERAGHQVATRQFFDLMRHEGECNMLRFLPPDSRQKIHDSWYRGASLKIYLDYQQIDTSIGTRVTFGKGDPVDELTRKVAANTTARFPSSTPLKGTAYGCTEFVQYFPEVVFMRVRWRNGKDSVHTILRNKAHSNVAFIFGEDARREPEEDTLVVVDGLIGNYPNFFLDLKEGEVQDLLKALHSVKGREAMEQVTLKYGVLRNSDRFWKTLEWFQEWDKKNHPIDHGIFDLKGYVVF